MKKIILASTSPRRKQLMELLGLPFEIMPSEYEEDMTLPMTPGELAKHLSFGKAKAVAGKNDHAIVIGSDTFVSFENQVLGKPHTGERAREMLRMLSGKKHTIFSGLAIIDTDSGKTITDVSTTDVYFATMSEDEIDFYVNTKEPLDKAGAYALQEKGSAFIQRIDGDYQGAIGLSLRLVVRYLKEFGVVLA